jgi:hypothetical protein
MSPFGPSPQRLKDGVVHSLEYFRADSMAVRPRPTPNDRVQVADEVASRSALVALNNRSHFTQHQLDALGRRSDEQLAVVFAYVLSEKITSYVETDRKWPKSPGKCLQNANRLPVLVDNGNCYSREQRMADDTVKFFYSIR